jgi:hypothetical protein
MALHEKIKCAKIAEDIFVYLLEKGFKKVSVTIETSEQETVFTVSLHELNEDFVSSFENQLFCKRDLSVEEYGWEVMIEDDSEFELDHLGYLLDSCIITKSKDQHQIVLIRKNQ